MNYYLKGVIRKDRFSVTFLDTSGQLKDSEQVSRFLISLERHEGISHAISIETDEGFELCIIYSPELISSHEIEQQALRENLKLNLSGPCTDTPDTKSRISRCKHTCASHSSSGSDTDTNSHPAGYTNDFLGKNQELILSLICGLFLCIAFISEYLGTNASVNIFHGYSLYLYLCSYIFGSYDLLSHAYRELRKGQFKFNIDLLMILAAAGAASLGAWAEGALLLFLFSLAHALEHYALDKAKNAIKALGDIVPQNARVRENNVDRVIPIQELKLGDLVVVLPGERLSVDGTVKSGGSYVNQAPITGESEPVYKTTESQVFAGTINGEGLLEIITSKVSGDRTLDRIIKLVEEAQTQKAPTEIFTEKFERIFVPSVLITVALVILLPPVFGFLDFHESFYRAMALLVGASPCALALGTPSAVLAGIAQAARNGVLIKGGAHLENLGRLRAFAFDKTGTLTIGKPQITEIVTFEETTQENLLRIAAAIEKHSQHPLAKAVVQKAKEMNVEIPHAEDVKSLTAKGMRAKIENTVVELGSLRLWQSDSINIPEKVLSAVLSLQKNGQSVIVVKQDALWLGALGVKDTPRDSAKQTLTSLRKLGIKSLIMLTGDNKGIGEAIGKEVGIDEVKADLLPDDKVKHIKQLAKIHKQVAMVGDGVNDAPALAHATVGISMGGAGTAIALETADVALMGDDLSKLSFAVALSRAARRTIQQNLYFSLFVIALLAVSTLTGVFGIGIAVIIHEGSTMVVILNSLRLLFYKQY